MSAQLIQKGLRACINFSHNHQHTKKTSVFDLQGWDKEDGREAQEEGDMGTCVCTWLIHFVVQQKLTQYCEAIVLQ